MRILLFLLCLALTTGLQGQTDGTNLFDDTFLHEIRFTSVDTLNYIATKEYQTANMEIDGNVLAEIGFKRKGNISGYPATNKFPIKVKTNKYVDGQEYDGIKEFMLHMNYQDPTMLREKLTYDICASMGLYSHRSAFARVYLNDVYWGLYTIVEGKDEMYKQVFGNRDADAMESTDFSNMCYEGPDLSDYYFQAGDFYTYDNDNGDFDSAWERFITMLDIANNTPAANYVNIVDDYLNIEDFFRYQAINVYLLNMDSYIQFRGNQRYVYDTLEQRWQIHPWDFNASFGLWNTNTATVTDYPLFPGFPCIGNKMEEVPALKDYYLNAMCELTQTVCDTTLMYARIDELSNQIRDAVNEDYRKVITNQNFEEGLEFGYHQLFFEDQPALKTVLRERYRLITDALNQEDYECAPVSSTTAPAENLDLLLYPNPAHDVLYFNADHLLEDDFSLRIVDFLGREWPVRYLDDSSFSIAHLDAGTYGCIIITEAGTTVRKFVKQ